MDVAKELGYKPPSDFVEDKRDPLVELKLTDSTELWLIQWPINHSSDFDGQVSLKLDNDGHLGSFESSSGKSYDVFNLKAQDPVGTVFLSSASEAKAGL
nr:mediator-associated protein 2-like [Ipomoea batatas]